MEIRVRASGMTCWRRLQDWQAAGVWRRLRQVLLLELERLQAAEALDSASIGAKRGRGGRPEPDGPRQAGQQAPLRHGCH